MYKKLLRPILFNIDPEKTHDLIFFLTGLIFKIPFSHFLISKLTTQFIYLPIQLQMTLVPLQKTSIKSMQLPKQLEVSQQYN